MARGRRKRGGDWVPAFHESLRRTRKLSVAAELAGVTRRTIHHRRRDPVFNAQVCEILGEVPTRGRFVSRSRRPPSEAHPGVQRFTAAEVIAALHAAGGVMEGAAKILGCHRSTVRGYADRDESVWAALRRR